MTFVQDFNLKAHNENKLLQWIQKSSSRELKGKKTEQ